MTTGRGSTTLTWSVETVDLTQETQIMCGDMGDGNIVDVEFVFADQVEQQVHRAFKDLKFDLVEA